MSARETVGPMGPTREDAYNLARQAAELDHKIAQLFERKRATILSDYNGQAHGTSWPSLKSQTLTIRHAFIEGGEVQLFLDHPQVKVSLRLSEVQLEDDPADRYELWGRAWPTLTGSYTAEVWNLVTGSRVAACSHRHKTRGSAERCAQGMARNIDRARRGGQVAS